jgi:hypothetical protein
MLSFSGFIWVNLFYKLLNQISTVISNGTASDVESLLTNAYHLDIPAPGSRFKLTACTNIGVIILFKNIQINISFTEVYRCYPRSNLFAYFER